jgi:hypothetical protein
MKELGLWLIVWIPSYIIFSYIFSIVSLWNAIAICGAIIVVALSVIAHNLGIKKGE